MVQYAAHYIILIAVQNYAKKVTWRLRSGKKLMPGVMQIAKRHNKKDVLVLFKGNFL